MMDDDDEGVKRRGKKHLSRKSSDMVNINIFIRKNNYSPCDYIQ